MNITTEIKRPCIGGGFNTYQMNQTNVWEGEQLGSELTDRHQIQSVACDHYENQDAEGIEIRPGLWAKKSLIKSVTWQIDPVMETRVLANVEFARPI